MKKVNCLIVEDEPLARNLLAEYVKKVPYLNLLEACPNAMAAMEIMRQHHVDLLFLDIQMPEITGTTLFKILPKNPWLFSPQLIPNMPLKVLSLMRLTTC